MAEENTQDTRSPQPPRRGARPFVGPAGAAGQPLPLLRVTPMPRPAPFVPAPGARPALGTAPRRVVPPSGSPTTERAAAAQTPAAEATAEIAAPVDPAGVDHEALVAWAGADVDPGAGGPADPAGPVTAPVAESLTDELPSESLHASPYEQFAAFDTTWYEAAIDVPEPPGARPAPPDVASLGSADERSVPSASAAAHDVMPSAMTAGPAWLMDDAEASAASGTQPGNAHAPLAEACAPAEPEDADSTGTTSVLPGDEGSWAEVTIMASADSIMAAEIEAEDALQPTTGDIIVGDVLSAGEWPDPLLAEYAPYLPTPAIATPAVVPDAVPESTDRYDDTVEETGGVAATANLDIDNNVEDVSPMGLIATWTSDGADADAAPETHEMRVAAALDRLAEQVRHGEIDVSSVAPGGPDAAVLAAVLAALLGGGRSSSR